jgi:hypothetical protein
VTTSEKRNVYICAAGHSGSTLLDLILGSHSEAVSLGEVTQLPKNLTLNTTCTCGTPVQQCGYWTSVLRLLGERLQLDILKEPYTLNLGFIDARVVIDQGKQTRWYKIHRKLITGAVYLYWRFRVPGLGLLTKGYERAMKNNLALYDAVRDVSGSRVIIDSTKHYVKAVGLYRSAPELTRIVLLTRDGRGVFYSNLKRSFGRKRSLQSWLNHFSHALPLFAKQLPESAVLQVHYEALCSDPVTTLKEICDFIGIAFEQSMLEFSEQENHIANGNDMRFIDSSEIRCDECWRKELKPGDAEYFKRYAWTLNRQLGYED